MLLKNWKLETHLSLDQRKRILGGLQILQKDICFDSTTNTALIKSHSKKNNNPDIYYVTLEKCDCVDFNRRGLPCKHMYALCFAIDRNTPLNNI